MSLNRTVKFRFACLLVLFSAGFAGVFIDREVESKGLDFVDKEKAKYEGECTTVLFSD